MATTTIPLWWNNFGNSKLQTSIKSIEIRDAHGKNN